jgi:hypothetical protein
MTLNSRWFFAPLALFVTFALFCSVRKRALEAEQSRPYANFTAQQILDRSLPLCRMVCPLANDLHLSAHPYPMSTAHQHRLRIWEVEYDDEASRQTGLVRWDATTGNLLYFSCFPLQPATDPSRAIDRRRAIAAARTWRSALRLTREGEGAHWQLAPTSEYDGKRWAVTWSCADRIIRIRIDAASGSLIDARNWSTEM